MNNLNKLLSDSQKRDGYKELESICKKNNIDIDSFSDEQKREFVNVIIANKLQRLGN